jgi:hypothetical protein
MNIYDIWNVACKEAGGGCFLLKNAGRNSFGMVRSKASADLDQISGLLCYSDAAVTINHYADLDMGVLKKVVDKLGAMK